jgi:hypothetical protein
MQQVAYSNGKVIEDTGEFRRVDELPWLDWHAHVTHNDSYLRLTTALKTPHGTMALRPIQAAALAYLHDYGGAFCPIPVGLGKTLITFLAPRIAVAERPALFIPAELREKTWRDFQTLYRHWFGPTIFMRRKSFDEAVFNYQELSRESGQKRLLEYKPDLVVADEAQALKNRNASCTKAVEKFMHAYFQTKFVALTGTPTMRSPMDYWHIMFWCLRRYMPMPRVEREAEQWSNSVRESKEISVNRPNARIFRKWLTPWEESQEYFRERLEGDLRVTRRAFGKRFSSAPGVVAAPEGSLSCDTPLYIRRLQWDPGTQARRWIDYVNVTQRSPNGVELQTPMDIWRIERELASGFWYRWDPQPPEWWLEPRRTYGWFVRNILFRDGELYSQFLYLNVNSPAQLAKAIVDGKAHDLSLKRAYQAWIDVKEKYVHESIGEWIDDGVLRAAADWLEREKGIVWTEHKAFGEKLSKITGIGFCSDGGLDDKGVLIDDYAGRPVIASVKANHKGRNLQAWNKNLGVTFPPNGAIVEQLIGRTHRPGQTRPVYFDWVCACGAQQAGFIQLLADAKYIEDSTTQKQKLNYAEKIG